MRLCLVLSTAVACLRISAVWSEHQRSRSRRRSVTESTTESTRVQQREALRSFYHSTGMDSMSIDWFFENDSDHCAFAGVTCDDDSYVTVLDLQDSSLSGKLPDVFDELPRLKHLRLYNNSLYGTIPKSLQLSQSLRHIHLGHNFLSGRLPDLSNLPVLSRLYLGRNAISGTIPPSLCLNTNLELIDLSFVTKMWGRIPSCFAEMSSLSSFRVTNVGLTGTVPSELCGWRNMNELQPNPFGCKAIACPAGYYQGNHGRQTSEGTTCQPCEVPSNVLGSTTCQWHETFDRTMAPTTPISDTEAPRGSIPTRPETSSPEMQSPPPVAIMSSPPTYEPAAMETPLPSCPPTAIVESPTPSTNPLQPPVLIPPVVMVSREPSNVPTVSSPSMLPTCFPSKVTSRPRSAVPSSKAPYTAPPKPHAMKPPTTSQPQNVRTGPPTTIPTVSSTASSNERLGTTAGFLTAASLLATVGLVLFLFVVWKRRCSAPGHVRFSDDLSFEYTYSKRQVEEPHSPGETSEFDVDSVVYQASSTYQPDIVITSTAIEALAPSTKRVPSILKTSLTRGQYVAKIRGEQTHLDEPSRKVRFTSPVPLPAPERTDGRRTMVSQNTDQDNEWLDWVLNSSGPLQTKFNPDTDSVISINSGNSTLSAMLASIDEAGSSEENASQVQHKSVLGIRDRSELRAANRGAHIKHKPNSIFRSQAGYHSSYSVHVVSNRFSGDESLGEERGEV